MPFRPVAVANGLGGSSILHAYTGTVSMSLEYLHAAGMKPIDVVAAPADNVEVEIQDRGGSQGRTLYVHVNGITVLRIGHIQVPIVVIQP